MQECQDFLREILDTLDTLDIYHARDDLFAMTYSDYFSPGEKNNLTKIR